MTLEELYKRIDLQPEMREKLCIIGEEVNLEKVNEILQQMQELKTAESAYRKLQTVLAEDEGNLKMLYCQLECARQVCETYQAKMIPDTIFLDTMKCFPRFLEECKKKNGHMFFDRGWWTYRQTSMAIFRIGELEYERKETDGEKVISIHIPSDADLSKEAVEDSLNRAKLFFGNYYPEWKECRYTCNSWLLSPVLKSMLPETSHIRSFQNRFEIVRENKDDREYMEWLFQIPGDTDPKDLPEGTSLQRNAKKYILEGGKIGSAFGILKVLSGHPHD